jgi:hypothetical protein
MMKRFLAFLMLLFFTSAAFPVDRSVKFSSYDPALTLNSFDNENSTAKFAGKLRITGTLFFEFDQSEPGQAVVINFAKFVPDASSLVRLPTVIAGFYPGPVKYISLAPANAALEAIYGKVEAERLKHGKEVEIRVAATLELRDYTVSVDCDSRTYWSRQYTVTRLNNIVVSSNQQLPHGC